MSEDLKEELFKRFAPWFPPRGDSRRALRPFRLQCGDGWMEILLRLCADLKPLVRELERQTGEQFKVVRAKEKLGALDFEVSHHSDAIDERIAEARRESSRTCELCGEPGNWLDEGGWVRARCEIHVHRLNLSGGRSGEASP